MHTSDWDDDAPAMIEDMDAVKPAAWEDDEKDQIPDPKGKNVDESMLHGCFAVG